MDKRGIVFTRGTWLLLGIFDVIIFMFILYKIIIGEVSYKYNIFSLFVFLILAVISFYQFNTIKYVKIKVVRK